MKVTIRQNDDGLSIYIPKKDLEAKVTAADPEYPFGGNLEIEGGMKLYIEPKSEMPKLPLTVRAKKV